MKPNHSYLCIKDFTKADVSFKENTFYDTDKEGFIVDESGYLYKVSESDEKEYFLDEDKIYYRLTPKGCLSCILEDLGISEFQLEDEKLDACFFVLETRMKQNGFVTGESNEGCETTETPESIFKKTIPLFYDIDDNTVDAAWILFKDLLIKQQDGRNR